MTSSFQPQGVESPPATLMRVAMGHFHARCLHAVAAAGVADHIGDAPRPAAAIAAEAGVNADALGRILRLLASEGVFEQVGNGWRHTEASRLLRRDNPMCFAPMANMIGDALNWQALAHLEHTLRTGEAGAFKVHPGGAWAYYQAHPDLARQFDAAMTAKSHGDIPLLVGAMDIGAATTLADIAGGRGHFLQALLDAHPHLTGVLYDQVDVVAAAPDHPRQTKQAGDFFTPDLPRADLYLMTHILHDWADAQCVAILRNLRACAPADARLCVFELFLPEGPEPHPAKTLDIVMMAVVSGRERTAQDYAGLFAASGWRADGVTPTASPMALHWARAV